MTKTHARIGTTILFALFLVGISGCSSNGFSLFGYSKENSTPPAAPIATPPVINPFNPTPPPSDGQSHTNNFTQGTASAQVDIVWMIDDSGSMENDQQAIKDNSAAFTSKLTAANVDFKLMVITSNVQDNGKLTNLCDGYVTSANASEFGDCAIVGTNSSGSGKEEGLEAMRRALDPSYSSGALNGDFLRAGADLHLIFVSDEEDEPDDQLFDSNSWKGETDPLTGSAITESDVDALREEMYAFLSTDPDYVLADGGHSYDTRYAYFPRVANHVNFFNSLKSAPAKVRAHAIVLTRVNNPADSTDECHNRSSTEEYGGRYIATANLLGGSVTDLCSSWSNTMNQIGLQVSGLERCFRLSHTPSDTSSIVATIDGSAVTAFSYVSTGNQVCFDEVPADGVAISITYH